MSYIDKFKNYIKKVNKVEQDNKKLEKRVKNLEKAVDSYNVLFNNLYVYYDLTPTEFLDDIHEIILLMLDFIDNVCKKHDIEWWIYAGSLLGAVRHGGFIPWDDDCDIVMMRKDYNKFLSVINDEIESHGLKNKFKVKTNEKIQSKYVPFSKIDFWNDGNLLGFIDIFPFDYVTDTTDMKERYSEESPRFHQSLNEGMSLEDSLNITFEKLSISQEKTPYIIPGIEHALRSYGLYETDKIYPLSTIKFEDRHYPCPKDPIYYLSYIFKDYMKIPKTVKIHQFHHRLITTDNIEEILDYNIKFLKEINDNF